MRREGGAARAADAQLVLDTLDEVVIDMPGTTCGSTASIASRAIRQACAISSSSASDLMRRSSFTSDEPSESRASGTTASSSTAVSAQGRCPSAIRVGSPSSPSASLNAARPSPSSSTTIVPGGGSPSRWKRDEHPRQHVDRLPARGEEGAGDPAVRVGDVPEGRQVALDPGQVLEVRAEGGTKSASRPRRASSSPSRSRRRVYSFASMPIRRPPSTRPSRGRATRARGRRGRAG